MLVVRLQGHGAGGDDGGRGGGDGGGGEEHTRTHATFPS